MPHESVRYRKQMEVRGEIDSPLPLKDAVEKVKAMADVTIPRSYKGARQRNKVDPTIEMVMHLGIDPKQADQALRGSFVFPKGIGKLKKVIAFCEGDLAAAAQAAGAFETGVESLIDKINKGWMDFDVAVAHPSVMGKVGRLGKTLGPTGKMPSPKSGTVTQDVATAVREFSAGKIEFRNDTGGNIHVPVGKASFSVEDLQANIEAFYNHVVKSRPASAKGQFIKQICLSGAMTPSVPVTMG